MQVEWYFYSRQSHVKNALAKHELMHSKFGSSRVVKVFDFPPSLKIIFWISFYYHYMKLT